MSHTLVSREDWEHYHRTGTVPEDSTLLSMMTDLLFTIKSLETIYGVDKASIVVYYLRSEWRALASMADARGIEGYMR